MKLKINREYATRHLGVAALFFGLSCWFLYDAIFVYPNLPSDGTHHTTAEFQYMFAAILGLASLVIATRVWLNWKSVVEWDSDKIWGSGVGSVPILFADIVGVEDAQWEREGIIVFLTKDGRRLTLDAWHHTGVRELVEKILPAGKSIEDDQKN